MSVIGNPVLLGTASGGGGGLTSVVRGTFKYTEQGWNTISLPYTGSGYPIACLVYVKNGCAYGDFATTIRRYAIVLFALTLSNTKTAPVYDGASTTPEYAYRYKNSTSDATTISGGTGSSAAVFNTATSTTTSAANAFRFSGDKEIKVRMVDTTHNTSTYGYLVDTDYEYIVVYSS